MVTMWWLDVLQILGVSSITSGAILFFVKRYYGKKDKIEEEKEREKERVKIEHSESHEKIDNFMEKQTEINESLKKEFEEFDRVVDSANKIMHILIESNQVLLRDKIIHLYNAYYVDSEKKYLPIYIRESLDNMYRQYKSLGGNGVVEDFVKKLYSLPTLPEQPEEP